MSAYDCCCCFKRCVVFVCCKTAENAVIRSHHVEALATQEVVAVGRVVIENIKVDLLTEELFELKNLCQLS